MHSIQMTFAMAVFTFKVCWSRKWMDSLEDDSISILLSTLWVFVAGYFYSFYLKPYSH